MAIQDDQKTDTGSILDRVISSQHTAAIEVFVPTETFALLLKAVSEKEQDVLRRRFGLLSDREETLEEIGKTYNVTRERIRQIETIAVQKIQKSKLFHDGIAPAERLLLGILNDHGGIMEDGLFFQETLSHAGNTLQQQRALSFLLGELLRSRFEHYSGDKDIRPSWKLRAQSLEIVRHAIQELVAIISSKNKPMLREDLVVSFRSSQLFREHASLYSDDVVSSFVALSSRIARNPFHEYGLIEWGTIVPKRMNDKIYLIMKKHGKPLHFTEIAKHINDAGFDRREAYAPTVHNELILNKEYVLVGRGIYALREWGYQPGVVAEVIVGILKEAGKPMTRNELVDSVLQRRMVKRNTVLLALTNKKLFQHLPDGRYAIAQET